jgi:hypothetical protein
VARVLIVGGGCRGRLLAASLVAEGNPVRITSRTPAACAPITRSGAECWIGTPLRLATLRGALDRVTIGCWLLGTASGERSELQQLHSTRLCQFLAQAIDTTMRGFVYEAPASSVAAGGEQIVRALGQRNAIGVAIVRADPGDLRVWLSEARDAVQSLLRDSR